MTLPTQCAHCGAENTIDTPRTDAVEMPLDRVDIIASLPAYIVHADFARELERELSEARQWLNERYKALSEADERAEKAEADVKEIRAALGDDGRRTHKELLELANKASQWREWKEKYIDLRNAHMAEGQDPAGTIWEHADKLHKELNASKAEVERLKKDRYPFQSFEQFCNFLTSTNLIDELAVSDPEGWDGGAELSRIEKAFDQYKNLTAYSLNR